MDTATTTIKPLSAGALRREIARFVEAMNQRSECDRALGRRSEPRRYRSWPLLVSCEPAARGVTFSVALHNASHHGIAFLSHRHFEPGTTVYIKLSWKDDRAPLVPAVIRHVTPKPDGFLVGCEFQFERTALVGHGHPR